MTIRHQSKPFIYILPVALFIIVLTTFANRPSAAAPAPPSTQQSVIMVERTTMFATEASTTVIIETSIVQRCASMCNQGPSGDHNTSAPTSPQTQASSLSWLLLLLTGINAALLLLDIDFGLVMGQIQQFRTAQLHLKETSTAPVTHTVSIIGQAVVMLVMQLLQM